MPFGFGPPSPAADLMAAPPPVQPVPQAQPQAQPQVQAQQAPQPYKPSFWDVAQGMLFDGSSPAEAAMAARQRAYATQQNTMMMDALQKAPPAQRLAMLLNPQKFGEEWAKNFSPINAGEGSSEVMFGGPAAGGGGFVAPKMGFDPVSGRGYTQTPAATTPTGPSLGGGFKAQDGVIMSDRTGPTGATYSTPQIMAPGATGTPFTPSLNGGPGGAMLPQAQHQGGSGSAGGLDPLAFFKSFVLPHEGGLNPRDMNGAPTKYGINQKANPGVDVTKLTPDDAASIFASKYFALSGAGSLPPALAAVHADTAFINPSKAHQFLKESGGDPGKYMDLRDAWMKGLVAKYPEAKPYERAWQNRNADLRQFAGSLAGGPPPAPPPPNDNGPAVQNVGNGFGQPFAQGKTHEIVPETDPAYKRFPPGTVLQRAPNGELSAMSGTQYGPDQLFSLRKQVLDAPEYKDYQSANAAWGAMQNAAKQPNGGIRAYALRDTFARLINPGAVARVGTIEAIKASQGIPANIQAYLMNLKGDGDVPPQVAQQIMDVAHGFLVSHYNTAKSLNDSNAEFAARHHIPVEDVTAPMDGPPQAMSIAALQHGIPPVGQRQAGHVYPTPRGQMKWTGTGWVPAGGH